MGLVQVFRASPCPPLLARYLFDLVAEEWRVSGKLYLLHLLASRERARTCGLARETETLDSEIREHLVHLHFPKRWHLARLFSDRGYETFGDGIFAVWASVLIQLCTLEQSWTRRLLGLPARKPYKLPEFALTGGFGFDQPNRSRISSAASSPLTKDSSVQW